ncbi:sigma-54 dependent transcriptional regulator [Kangiella sp. TOML190]|uniref:sigma-54-dependent transcriptional regulator n=1 Tax=Kangiella sp. TOML190 TaxID=2931351 RepID=UPI00203B8799|nr:sigma-54 dependent transcriptional regulator [Kangiella sp. TOML190]
MDTFKVLVVEDEEAQGKLIQSILQQRDYAVDWVESAEAAYQKITSENFSIVLSDWRLPEKDGLWLLQQTQKVAPQLYFILATAYGSIQHAIEAIKAGASDYLTKPYSRDQLFFCIDRAVDTLQLSQQNQQLKSELKERQQLVDMVGSSKPMQTIFNQVEKLAPTNATIHIAGASGTGKELAARALHQLSPRTKQPFIVINCGAIPEGLAEAELFGAEKGAFTGSHARKIGCFEAADGGTLFLDEVAELSPAIQTKLLRVLQEKTVTRVGATSPINIDVRVISATHKSLEALVAAGDFREDLWYRLNVVPIKMPALKDRIEDLPALITFFNEKHAKNHQSRPIQFTDGALQQLEHYLWPGNIRELSHVIERLMLLSDSGKVKRGDLEFLNQQQSKTSSLVLPKQGVDWAMMEQDFYQQALKYSKGNKKKAAELLGLSYKSFLYRLEKFLISE